MDLQTHQADPTRASKWEIAVIFVIVAATMALLTL